MMMTKTNMQLLSRGEVLDASLDYFGELVPFTGDTGSQMELDSHLQKHGYLYIRGLLDRSAAQQVRLEICEQMYQQGLLDPNAGVIDCVPNPELSLALEKGKGSASYDDIIPACRSYHDLIYGKKVESFFATLLGGETRHFDFTWFRAVAPGMGTVPHCDVVYMGRGTHELYKTRASVLVTGLRLLRAIQK